MADLKLQKGDIVSLKATKIQRTTKAPFPKQDGSTNYQYYITMEDKKGDSVVCEYLSQKETQDEFFAGIFQYIEVKFLSQRGTPEIVPTEEPRQIHNSARLEEKKVAPGNTSVVDEFLSGKHKEKEANCYSTPAHGKSITFAFGYAKDILVAEIAVNGRLITDADIDRMIGWADKINDKICERLTF